MLKKIDSMDINKENDDSERDEKDNLTAKNHENNTCSITKLSRFVCSMFTQKINNQNSKLELNKDTEKLRFDIKSKLFEKLLQDSSTIPSSQFISFKNKKFTKLIKLFQTCENYYSMMMLNGHSNEDVYSSQIYKNIQCLPRETNNLKYYLCGICLHVLVEPVTLVCGCTFCKSCIDEYNQCQFQTAALKQYYEQTKLLFKCKNCGLSHNNNSSQYLNQNIFITKIVDKRFKKQIDSRILRNDIRKCISLKQIDFYNGLNLLENAYNLGI